MNIRKKIISEFVVLIMILSCVIQIPVRSMAKQKYGLEAPYIQNGVSTWDCVCFGHYRQEGTKGAGTINIEDEKQPIKWRVLSVSDDEDDYYNGEDEMEDSVIYAKKSVTKYIGDKDFDIDYGIYGDGKVSYESSNKKVLTVDEYGSVKIRGCGTAIVSIYVDGTDNFYFAIKDVKVTILPGKIKNFKVKALEGGLKCSWKKMNFNNVKCVIQASEDKKFKKYVVARPYSQLKKGYWSGGGLKRNKMYYIRIRQITKLKDEDFHFGKWSEVIRIKTK